MVSVFCSRRSSEPRSMNSNISFGNKFDLAKQPWEQKTGAKRRRYFAFLRIVRDDRTCGPGSALAAAYRRHCRRKPEILPNSAAESGPNRRDRKNPWIIPFAHR